MDCSNLKKGQSLWVIPSNLDEIFDIKKVKFNSVLHSSENGFFILIVEENGRQLCYSFIDVFETFEEAEIQSLITILKIESEFEDTEKVFTKFNNNFVLRDQFFKRDYVTKARKKLEYYKEEYPEEVLSKMMQRRFG